MYITNTALNDIEVIFQLFDNAIEYQKQNGFDLWPRFDQKLIETEIDEKRHWKIMEGEVIAGFFSVMYNDPVIWAEKDKDPAVYLHRITTNPHFKGKGLIRIIKVWAEEHARKSNKKYLRMDTWGNNGSLKNYYIKSGFNYIGQKKLNNTEGLPAHYGGNFLSLFENEV